uniref:Rv3235 family protein n=1 Tax=Plantactinospora solaniradicis TaxID=1723736 RepID=UPI00366DC01F
MPPLDPPFDDEYVPEIWPDRPTEPTTRSVATPEPTPRPIATSEPTIRPVATTSQQTRAVSARRPLRAVPVARAGGPVPPECGATAAPAAVAPLPEALAGATPEAKHAARRFLATCLEIVNGYRPAGHVRPLSSPAEAAGIVEQLASAATRIGGRSRPGQPVRTVRLQRLRVCEPRPGVAEAAAAVGVAGRTWAVAFRIERRRGSWVGVSVEVL